MTPAALFDEPPPPRWTGQTLPAVWTGLDRRCPYCHAGTLTADATYTAEPLFIDAGYGHAIERDVAICQTCHRPHVTAQRATRPIIRPRRPPGGDPPGPQQ